MDFNCINSNGINDKSDFGSFPKPFNAIQRYTYFFLQFENAETFRFKMNYLTILNLNFLLI
ncbi:hypothetical protein BBH99_04775 [Chryseobacterium contaminans]|uniref:Uncharacterized protein n=1 Tax=Chryseobacterium contaminans TaxID=1423959 RepID=A0ABX2XA13_9FLAO|nr:hypothetical protein BBH99_04775 [Chryseobacterium contaminans]